MRYMDVRSLKTPQPLPTKCNGGYSAKYIAIPPQHYVLAHIHCSTKYGVSPLPIQWLFAICTIFYQPIGPIHSVLKYLPQGRRTTIVTQDRIHSTQMDPIESFTMGFTNFTTQHRDSAGVDISWV